MSTESFQEFLARLLGPNAAQEFEVLKEQEPDFAKLMKDFAIQMVWQRNGLPLKEKSIATISSQIALGRWDQVETHMKSFLNIGGSPDELRELALHLIVYCGFPAALSALRILKKIQA